jgi:RNA-binding protein
MNVPMPKIDLSPAQRAALRSQAHGLNPVVMIGAEGLTLPVISETDRALAAHALIKVRVLGDDRETRQAIFLELCETLNAAPVQHIGKMLVIWREGAVVMAQPELPHAMMEKQHAARAPRKVVIRKPATSTNRRPRPERVTVLGNERVTHGGLVKRAKPRQVSRKKSALD